ncbi:MAG: hypothetical protein IJ401_08745 [Oscillospiraceae bacterium]|nr:hypothetical protein [Oscillospiraceae bacterium]
MKSKILFMALLSVLLTSCSNTENKEQNNTDTKTTTNPFDTVVTTTVSGEVTDIEEDIEIPQSPSSRIDLSSMNGKEFDYSGEEIAFEITISTFVADCNYSLGLICDNTLIPFSVDDTEYSMMSDVLCKAEEEKTIKVKFHPCGKEGETLEFSPVILVDTNAVPLNKYNIPSPNCAYISSKLFSGSINMKTDGKESYDIFENNNITTLGQSVVDYYAEIDKDAYTTLEDGTTVSVSTLRDNSVIDFLNSDETVNGLSKYITVDNSFEFDFVFAGKPEKLTFYCWSNKGFLPVFEGAYSSVAELTEYNQQIVFNCKLSGSDYSDIEKIKVFGLNKDGMVFVSDTFAVMDSEVEKEYKDWLESFEQ